jgi:hypothetical protein
MVTKAAFRTLKAEMDKKERVFLKGKGRAEAHIWEIEDETVFDLLNEEFAALTKDVWSDYITARDALKSAEEALIEYALSIAPAKIRETLRRGMRVIAFRNRLIDDVMLLDTKTVPV